MTMKATLPLIASSALAAGFAYFYWRNGRQATPATLRSTQLRSPTATNLEANASEASRLAWQDVIDVDIDLPPEGEEIDIDLVDLDQDDDDDYAVLSPSQLGAAWLSRATQTISGVPPHRDPSSDELDPAGRPTDPDIAQASAWPSYSRPSVAKDIWGGPLAEEKEEEEV
jgi:hypothetical protein